MKRTVTKPSMLEKLARKKMPTIVSIVSEVDKPTMIQSLKTRGRPKSKPTLNEISYTLNNDVTNVEQDLLGKEDCGISENASVLVLSVNERVPPSTEDSQPVIVNSRTYTSSVDRTAPRVPIQRRKLFVAVEQYWNYDQPCGHCGCIWLTTHTRLQMKKCCRGGKVFVDPVFPKLFRLPDSLKCLALERGRHMGQSSAMYNNIFSIAGVGVDNGRGGGFESIIGTS
jgi:hypothetical protein